MNTLSTKDLKERFENAGKQVINEVKAKRERSVKGAHLLKTFLDIAQESGCSVEEQSGFYKITGTVPKKIVYVAKNGGRVDLNGFTVECGVITQVSPDEARQRHLGRVRGQFNFNNSDEGLVAAFKQVINTLTVSVNPDTVTEVQQ